MDFFFLQRLRKKKSQKEMARRKMARNPPLLRIHHSLDLETCEPLKDDQKRFVLREREPNSVREHCFAFEPLQLLLYFLHTGDFRNPITRRVLRDRDLRRLGARCEGQANFELRGKVYTVGSNLAELRYDIASHAALRQMWEQACRTNWTRFLNDRCNSHLQTFLLTCAAFKTHDGTAFRVFAHECFRQSPMAL